jgi:hypothetical protein
MECSGRMMAFVEGKAEIRNIVGIGRPIADEFATIIRLRPGSQISIKSPF